MKQITWILILIPLLQACATHVPMSEMVMFDKDVRPDTQQDDEQFVITIFDPKPSTEDFREEFSGDYKGDNRSTPKFSVAGTKLYQNNVGFSISIGDATGLDGTVKVFPNHYATASMSIVSGRHFPSVNLFKSKFKKPSIFNFHLALQRPVINSEGLGLSLGYFYQRDFMERSVYIPPDCLVCFGETEYTTLSFGSHGIKSRLLIRSRNRSRVSFSMLTQIGNIIETNRYYVSLGLSWTPFVKL